MPTTYYDVIGDSNDPANFAADDGTMSPGALWTCVDEPPTSPNTSDYGYHTGVPMFEPIMDLDIEPPTFGASDDLRIRLYCGTPVTADVVRAQITDASLIDDDDVVAATLSGNVDVPAVSDLIELVMVPGGPSSSYNFATARIQFQVTFLNNAEMRVYAVDFAVTEDEDEWAEGPGGQRAENASHHTMMV